MSFFFAVSTSLFFLVSPPLFIRPDDPRVVASHGYHTIPTFVHSLRRPHRYHSTRLRFLTLIDSLRYISRKPHASHSLAHKSSSTSPSHPNHIYPLRIQNPSNATPQRRPSPLPLFGCLPRGSLWLGPIDRVCVLFVAHPCCIANDGSQTCTIFQLSPSLSWYPKANTPRRDSRSTPFRFLSNGRHISFTLILLLSHFPIL